MNEDGTTFVGGAQRAIAIVVPWTFVAVFFLAYWNLLLPRFRDNGLLTILVVFASIALMSFTVAAVTFTRDVLAGREV